MIKLQVIGNLGRDAVINQVNGKTVINFSVAHTEKFKDQQGNLQDKTIWVDCSFWTERNVGPYLLKGKTVFVEGSPHVENYVSKDGKQGVSLRLRVFDMQFVGGGNRDNDSQNSNPNQQNSSATTATSSPQNTPQSAEPPLQNFESGTADDLPF